MNAPADPQLPHERTTPPPHATFGQVAGAVFWSFFGVRKGQAMRRDAVNIKPHQVIIVGVISAAIFVLVLLLIARAIVNSAAG